MKIFNILLMAAAVISISSCKKDKENPTIEVTGPAEHSTYSWGEEVHMMATFKDDRALKTFEAFVGNEAGVLNSDFGFDISGDIGALEYAFHDHFVVPDSAPAMAWVHFSVTDEEAKTTTAKWMLHFEE